jgi:hypothetical protein
MFRNLPGLVALELLAVALLIGSPSGTVAGQRVARDVFPPPGSRVRVATHTGERVAGTLAAAVDDTLTLIVVSQRTGRPARHLLQTGQVRGLWVSRGRSHAAGALRGLLVGSLTGLTLGAVIGASKAVGEYGCEMCPRGRLEGALLIGTEGLIVGLPVGVIVGTLVGVERWERRR